MQDLFIESPQLHDSSQQQNRFGFRFAPKIRCRRGDNFFRSGIQNLTQMNQSAHGQAGYSIFVPAVDLLSDAKQGRQFRAREFSLIAGFAKADADQVFEFGAKCNPSVKRFSIDRLVYAWIIDLLQTEFINPLLQWWS
ncbi:hypothetical protein ATY75_29785 [Rhizobium sp. N122]|nr:hypothetical protein ATY75_29785 [Rhizobium sp. N122]PON05018.1 hypothetical protein ATY29_23750 [Rhizobium hidalgonense]